MVIRPLYDGVGPYLPWLKHVAETQPLTSEKRIGAFPWFRTYVFLYRFERP